MKPGGYNLVMRETGGINGGQSPDHTVHTVVANPVHAATIGSMDLEDDGGRASAASDDGATSHHLHLRAPRVFEPDHD